MSATRTHRIVSSAAAGALGLLLLASAGHGQAVPASASERTVAGSAPAKRAAAPDDVSIRPFRFTASDEELADLRKRIEATRWPEKETVADAIQGVQLATTRKLARYWATDYDWRKCEAKLNAMPQFITGRSCRTSRRRRRGLTAGCRGTWRRSASSACTRIPADATRARPRSATS